MSAGRCSRCGGEGNVEYGSDGQSYCSACIFYGINKQCWRCRMYLPASELQQYQGNWVCPYCIMDLKAEAQKMEKPQKEYKAEKYPIQPVSYSERCERCGRETEIFYIWNGRRLCSSCLEEEQKKWGTVGGGPSAAPYRVTYGKKEGLIGSIISRALERIGLRKRKLEGEIVAAPKVAEAKGEKEKPTSVVSFMRGKPLAEEPEKKEAEAVGKAEEKPEGQEGLKAPEEEKKPKPQGEGIMKSTPLKPLEKPVGKPPALKAAPKPAGKVPGRRRKKIIGRSKRK
ncbi:hypothetical protein H0O02_03165 [Candidatus Micrarchaeota archaeon]|nr:hypothetical protein [Candidatus Micrarchaeota archaeon]